MKSVSHATDIYSAIWPLHFVSRIFGLAPYSLKPGSQREKYATIFTRLYRMWSMFCLILLVALENVCITRSIIANATLKQKVTGMLYVTSLCFYSIITLFQSLTVNGSNLREILHKFSEIDQIFSSKMYRSQIYKNTRLFLTL
jgi:hypothetical protein